VPVGLERVELPPDEHVLELVARGGDHGPAPVDVESEAGQVFLPDRGEELQPLVCICEFVDICVGYAHLQ